MEGIVFLVIISLVVRALYRNGKEAQRKGAEQRQAQGGESVPQPRPRTRVRFPGSLPEWIEILAEKAAIERGEQTGPVQTTPAPPPPQQAYVPLGGSMPDISTEGCQTFPRDCESPHHTLRIERRREVWEPARQGSPFAFMDGMPEAVKGVVYAEILTRPQQRRRLRP